MKNKLILLAIILIAVFCFSNNTLACVTDWKCGFWSECSGGQQFRPCVDFNSCSIFSDKPATIQPCTYSGSCIPSWELGTWSACVNNIKIRSYFDKNNCGVLTNKPADEILTCSNTCTPNWQPGAWSTCTNGMQARSYTDTNNCGITTSKPEDETQSCVDISCLSTKNCQDRYQNCYYICSSNSQCLQINTLVALKPYPDCSTVLPCTPNWQPTAWSTCTNGMQARSYTDINNCGITTSKPEDETQSCTIPTTCTDSDNGLYYFAKGIANYKGVAYTDSCEEKYPDYVLEYYCDATGVKWGWGLCANGCFDGACRITPINNCVPNWQPTAWSTCTNGMQARSYTDINNCGVITNRPAIETQSCQSACVENWQRKKGECEYGLRVMISEDLNKCGTTINKPNDISVDDIDCSIVSGCISKWKATSWGCVNGSQTVRYIDVNNCAVPTPTKPMDETKACQIPIVDVKINNSDGPINLPLYSSLADISWTTFGQVSSCTASCTKDNSWSGSKSSSGGSERVGNFSALGQYNYEILCNTPSGNISDSVLVNVSSTTVDLKANSSDGPINITSGNRVQLSWQTNQANSCIASGDTNWSGTKSNSGGPVYSDYIFSTKTFTLTCKDALNNTVTDSVIVNIGITNTCISNWVAGNWSTCSNGMQARSYTDVNSCGVTTGRPADETQSCGSNLPIVDVKINNSDGPITLPVGSKATLMWTSKNTTSCGGSPNALSGSQTITVALGVKMFTAKCSNSTKSATDTVTIIGTEVQNTGNLQCEDSSRGIIYNVDRSFVSSCDIFFTKLK